MHIDLGIVMSLLGKAQEVPGCFERALTVEPGNATAFSNYLHSLNYLPEWDSNALFEQHLGYARTFARPLLPIQRGQLQRQPGGRIKVGYVSGDLREFAVAWFIEPVLAHHDRSAYEIFCYSNHTIVDSVTQRLQSHAGHWRMVAAMPDEELARVIRQDGIDILVDLSGHTRHNRLTMFALKPAPVQVSWLGYFNTTGLHLQQDRQAQRLGARPVDADPASASRQLPGAEIDRVPRRRDSQPVP